LVITKWLEAFITAIQKATGENSFTYVTAVPKLMGDAQVWVTHPPFCEAMAGNPIKLITLKEMLEEVYGQLKTTLAGAELGRMFQLFRAAGVQI
jgi:hypothetical protein